MQRALWEILLLSVPAGVLGAWVVMRRLAFMSHALGHVTFPAVVVAYLAGWSVFGVALSTTIAVVLALALLARRVELGDGVAVAVVLSTMTALGALLVSNIADPGVGADSILFGSLLALDGADVARTAVVALVALAVGTGLGRPLLAATFDRDLARSAPLPVVALEGALLVALAATVSVAVSIVGSLMLSAVVLVPAATARTLSRRWWTLQIAGVALAATTGVVGLWLSVRLDAPPGACIAVVAVALYAAISAVPSFTTPQSPTHVT